MGIPRFYRWISERYPQINHLISDVSLLPEFDNLYLDMNGIIHQCTHPNDSDQSETVSERDQILGIFTYIDRIVTHIVKPKKLLYLAVDGVAPRAKLNQQRSRRFRAGLDLMKAKEEMQGDDDSGTASKEIFDSNCITPGTEFMTRLSKHLKYFIRRKIKDDPMWQNLTIIFSGHEVPGEGEHKIVEFVRNIKGQPGYPPNVRHCMYGSDADLMLLGVAVHEPHFTLLREVVDWNMNSRKSENAKKIVIQQTKEQQWQMVHLSLFREYLDFELRVDAPFYDTERALDDFIFMTFFLGNDFIPHSPTLEISEDAIALLLMTYRKLLLKWGGYLTENGKLSDPARLEEIFYTIGTMEEDILVKRAVEQAKFAKRRNGGRNNPRPQKVESDSEDEAEVDFEEALLEAIEAKCYDTDENIDEDPDIITLSGSDSFQETKLAYYKKKFGISVDQPELLDSVRRAYMEAMLWCLEYYFQGTSSWGWFYPFHYAPMISDLTNLSPILESIKFSMGKPLKPFEQLLSCLPAASCSLLPAPYRFLMTSPESPVIDFYPPEFDIDMDGKRNAWEGVNLLPFIDAQRLKEAIKKHAPDALLTQAELERNTFGPVLIFRHDSSRIENIESSFPQAGLPDILCCNSFMLTFNLPDPPQGGFKSKLVPGVTLPLAGFPSLRTLPISNLSLESVGLNCFGMNSRKDSLMLHIEGDGKMNQICQAELEPIAKTLLGKTVFVNWPNLHEAKVLAVSNETGEYRLNDIDSTFFPHFRQYVGLEIDNWRQIAVGESRKYRLGREVPGSGGVDIGPISVFLHVVVLQGMVRDAKTGEIKKKFGTQDSMIPSQLAVLESPVVDPRFEEKEAPPLAERFPTQCQIVVTHGKYQGNLAEVVSVENNRTLTLSINVLEPEPPFGHTIAKQIVDRYYSAGQLSKRLGISPNILGQIVGTVIVNPKRYNIGLNLKVKKEFKLLGYCQLASRNISSASDSSSTNVWLRNDSVKVVGCEDTSAGQETDASGAWEYSERALHVLAAYKRKFPVVFESLERLGYTRSYNAAEFFPNAQDPKKVCEEIRLWLEQLETHKMPLVPVTTTAMPKEAIAAIEHAATARHDLVVKNPVQLSVPGMHPENVFRPNPAANHDISSISNSSTRKGATKPRLGDRVVNLTARSVPFGIRGTVIAIHADSGCVEVVFDVEFVGGSSLNGMCSNYRGKLIPWASLYTIKPNDKKNSTGETQQKSKSQRKNSNKSGARAQTPTNKDMKGPIKILSKPKPPAAAQDNGSVTKVAAAPAKKVAAVAAKVPKKAKESKAGPIPTSTFNALPPNEKMNHLMSGASQRRCELAVSDAETSGTSSYFQQLQHQAQQQGTPRPPPPLPPGPVPTPAPPLPEDQQRFQHAMNQAFSGLAIARPPPPRPQYGAAPPMPMAPPPPPPHHYGYPMMSRPPPPPPRPDERDFPSLSQAQAIPKRKGKVKVAKATKGTAAAAPVAKTPAGLMMPTQILRRPPPPSSD